MTNYSELYYLKNKEQIIKKNIERQSKSPKYKEYQKQYYLKHKKVKNIKNIVKPSLTITL